jgi:hypothetical protein
MVVAFLQARDCLGHEEGASFRRYRLLFIDQFIPVPIVAIAVKMLMHHYPAKNRRLHGASRGQNFTSERQHVWIHLLLLLEKPIALPAAIKLIPPGMRIKRRLNSGHGRTISPKRSLGTNPSTYTMMNT